MTDPELFETMYARHASVLEHGVDLESRMIFLVGDICSPRAENIVATIYLLNQLDSFSPITLKINSNGGDESMMFYLYDSLRESKAPIYTIACGYVCSAAVPLLISGNKRYATPNSWFMTHKGQFQMAGDEDEVRAMSDVNAIVAKRYWNILASHTKNSAKWWFDKSKDSGQLWLDSAAMLKHGIVDTIIYPKKSKNKKVKIAK